MWHRLEHWLGWNTGHIVYFPRNGREWMAFMCDGCGELIGMEEVQLDKELMRDYE